MMLLSPLPPHPVTAFLLGNAILKANWRQGLCRSTRVKGPFPSQAPAWQSLENIFANLRQPPLNLTSREAVSFFRSTRREDAMKSETLKVGDLAKRTGLTIRALHHYDEIGLL